MNSKISPYTPTINSMSARLGFVVMTLSARACANRALCTCRCRPFVCSTVWLLPSPDGTSVRLLQQIRYVVGDQVYYLLRVGFAGRQAGRGPHGLFRPVGIAIAQGSQ